jgi:polysaccharide pyruvyl transferase WcaK-like protein
MSCAPTTRFEPGTDADRRAATIAGGNHRTSRATKTLIRGGGFINKGAEAMVRTVQAELDRRLRDVRYFVVPNAIEANTESSVAAAGLATLSPHQFTRRAGLMQMLCRMRTDLGRAREIYRTRYAWLRTLGEIERVHAVIDISGYGYGDPWGRMPALEARDYVTFAQQLNKPYIFMPQAWGPFECRPSRPHYQEMCARAALLFARDELSRSHLADLLNKPAAEIDLRPDIAFRFRPDPPEMGSAILAGLGISEARGPLVGVAPNRQMYKRMPGTGLQNQYVRALVEICKSIRARGVSVVLIPHEIEPTDNGTTDDRLLCSMVASAVGDPHVAAMVGRYAAGQIKAVIGRLRMLVGSRFHALIAALSCRVPVVALGWSHKYVELLRPFDMEEYVLNHDQIWRADLRTLVTDAFDRHEELRARLEEQLPGVEQSVDETFDRVCEVVFAAAR